MVAVMDRVDPDIKDRVQDLDPEGARTVSLVLRGLSQIEEQVAHARGMIDRAIGLRSASLWRASAEAVDQVIEECFDVFHKAVELKDSLSETEAADLIPELEKRISQVEDSIVETEQLNDAVLGPLHITAVEKLLAGKTGVEVNHVEDQVSRYIDACPMETMVLVFESPSALSPLALLKLQIDRRSISVSLVDPPDQDTAKTSLSSKMSITMVCNAILRSVEDLRTR